MQLCNWKLLFWSCHQSFTSLTHPALIDNYLMMISRSTSKVYKQGPQLAVLNYSSLRPHLCVIAHTLFWPRWIFLFSLWILKYVLKKREEAEGCMYPCLCLLPYPIPNIIFLSVRFLTVFFFNELIGIAAAKLLFPQHQILWMTQKELRNFKSCFNILLMLGGKQEVDSKTSWL